MKFRGCLLALLLITCSLQAQELQRIRKFGRNKGHLKMYLHSPPSVAAGSKASLVVVLHGCTQCAGSVAAQTGWNKLADEHGFYVLYPQQRFFNNPEKCFRWYKRKHIKKNRGENASIKMMIEHMKDHYPVDSSKVFITGLSAGAAMGVIMMAIIPAPSTQEASLQARLTRPAAGSSPADWLCWDGA